MRNNIGHRIKHNRFRIQVGQKLQEIEKQICVALGSYDFQVELDVREPVSTHKQPRAMCFNVLKNGKKLYFGKKINLLRTPDYNLNAGMKLLNGKNFIKKSINVYEKLKSTNLTPEVKLVSDDILLFDYINYPTLLSLANSPANIESLLALTISGLRNLHHQGIVHLDPNWANMFLIKAGQSPIFIDFDRDLAEAQLSINGSSIDFFKVYSELFSSKFLVEFNVSNIEKLSQIFWSSLDREEKFSFSSITRSHISILEPKLFEKPILQLALNTLENEMNRKF